MATCVGTIANSFEVWTRAFTVPGQSTDVDEAQLSLTAQLNRFFAVNNSITIAALSFFSSGKATPDGGQPSYGVRLTLMSGGTQYNAREFDNPAALEAYCAANPLQWPAHVFNLVPVGNATSLTRLVGVFANRNQLHLRGRQPQVVPALADEVVAFFDSGAFEVDVPQNLTEVIRGVNLGNADWPLGGNAPMVKTPKRNTWAGVAPCAYAGAGPSEVQALPDCGYLDNCCGDLEPLSGSTGIVRNCKICQDPDEPSIPFSPTEPLTCDWKSFRWADFAVFKHVSGGIRNTSIARNGNRVGVLGLYSGVPGPDPYIIRYTDDGSSWTDSDSVASTTGGDKSFFYDPINDWWALFISATRKVMINNNNLVGAWSEIDLSVLPSVDNFDNDLYYEGNKYFLVPDNGFISDTPPFKFYVSDDLMSWTLCSVPDDTIYYDTKGLCFDGLYWYLLVSSSVSLPSELWRSTDGVNWSLFIADTAALFGGVITDNIPQIAVGDGRLVLFATTSSAIAVGGFTIYSDDHGSTWSTPVQVFTSGVLIAILTYVDGYFFILGQEFSPTGISYTTASYYYGSVNAESWEFCSSSFLASISISRVPATNRWLVPSFLSVFLSTPYVVYKDGN